MVDHMSEERYIARLHERVDYYRTNPDWCADKLHQLLNLADEYEDTGLAGIVAEAIREIVGTTSRYDDIRLWRDGGEPDA